MRKQVSIIALMITGSVAFYSCAQSFMIAEANMLAGASYSVKEHFQASNSHALIAKKAVNVSLENYASMADQYLTRFSKSTLQGKDLANAAVETYKIYGTFIPVDFALAQMQLESACGTRGKSPINNPFNVGEGDSGTHQRFDSSAEGILAWYDLIAREYLHGKEIEHLLHNYVNRSGKRYATSTDYEGKLKRQMKYIERWLEDPNNAES